MDAQAVVVGRMHGGTVDVLRVGQDVRTNRRTCFGAASLPWEEGEPLGEPLERLLKWRVDEPVILAVETPPLCGGSLVVPAAVPDHPRRQVDAREREEEVRWRARDTFREMATQYFGCSLEQVELLTDVVTGIRVTELVDHGSPIPPALATATAVFTVGTEHQAVPVVVPSDIPDCHLVLLPMLVSDLISPTTTGSLLLMEEEQLSFVVCGGGVVRAVRSVPLGGRFMADALQEHLGCSPREAAFLLNQMDQGSLAPQSTRTLLKILHSLGRLFRAAGRLLTEHFPPGDPIESVSVTGLWPLIAHRLFSVSGGAFQGLPPSATCRVLPRAEIACADSAAASSLGRLAGRALLEAAVESVLRAMVSPAGSPRLRARAFA